MTWLIYTRYHLTMVKSTVKTDSVYRRTAVQLPDKRQQDAQRWDHQQQQLLPQWQELRLSSGWQASSASLLVACAALP